MKKIQDNFTRLFLLLLIVLLIGIFFYALPGQIGGFKIKKMDWLADLRKPVGNQAMDSLREGLADEEKADSLRTDSLPLLAEARRDSLAKGLYLPPGADSTGAHIEDYTPHRKALERFFLALRASRRRPVRIAFLGDSFIEGDILVADFRQALQQQFGGRGVGFVPVNSPA
ncbi:MAG: hypothetical protein LBL81_02555, partial [Tannerella sp.]|nr:hypothetical protein [Tannerella sp.]